MPLVQVSLIEGRPAEVGERLIAELTETIVRVLETPKESVRVILYEVPPELWGVAGVSKGAK
jgi:4-oxalocrotonate tautomerase